LKRLVDQEPTLPGIVAPCAGAWIETRTPELTTTVPRCRPLRGGVD